MVEKLKKGDWLVENCLFVKLDYRYLKTSGDLMEV